MKISTLRVATIALLILLAVVTFLSLRTLRRLPNVVVYFVKSEETSFTLEPTYRRSTTNTLEEQLRYAMQTLIDGPNGTEQQQGLSSSLPPTTEILGLEVEGNRAVVNLSETVEEGGGMAAMRGRLEQIFYTLSQPKDINEVSLLVEGQPVTVFGGEGILVDNPWQRTNRDTLPRW